MSENEISSHARKFIADYVTSVAQLEMLLLLRTNPEQLWTAEQMSHELRIEPDWATAQLRNLCERGLLNCTEPDERHFHYRPRTPELQEAVTAVAQAYLLHRVRVIELIYSRPTSTIRAFADAFRLRKDQPNG